MKSRATLDARRPAGNAGKEGEEVGTMGVAALLQMAGIGGRAWTWARGASRMRQGDIQTVGIVFPNERMQLTGPALLTSDV
jgi:hypothetical protein